MGYVGVSAMRRKLIPLLTVFALLLVAAGGATAAGDASTNISADETATDGDVGICLVGADSPCNDAPDDAESATDANESADGERTGNDDGADDGQMWLPEDQNRDGEIDDRFRGDGNTSVGDEQHADGETSSDDAGICLVGADSPCNEAANSGESSNGTTHIEPVADNGTHPTPSDGPAETGSGSCLVQN